MRTADILYSRPVIGRKRSKQHEAANGCSSPGTAIHKTWPTIAFVVAAPSIALSQATQYISRLGCLGPGGDIARQLARRRARSSSPTPGAVEAGLTAGVAKPDYNRSRNVG